MVIAYHGKSMGQNSALIYRQEITVSQHVCT